MSSAKLTFQNANGARLDGRLEMPSGEPRGIAIFAHCFTCSKNVHAATRVSRGLTEHGWAVLRFDFTGLGASEGDFANAGFSGNVEDLVAAAAHLRRHFVAPSLLIGHSLGGAAVLLAAARIPEVRAVAAIAAPSDPEHVLEHFRADLSEIEARGSALVRLAGRDFRISKSFVDDLRAQDLSGVLASCRKAVVFFHSPQDRTVPIDEARKLYDMARHPKSFISLDGADHLLTDEADAAYVAGVLAAWAERYVSGPDSTTG